MKKLSIVMAAILCCSAPAAAQEWPEDMMKPENYPWEALWPVNNAEEATGLMLGDEYSKQVGKYHAFGEETNPSGMAHNFSYRVKFRTEMTHDELAARVGAMKIGEADPFTNTGVAGELKLVGTERVGPHTCRQVEWTIRKTSGAVVGNKAGKASKFELFCFDPNASKWFKVDRSL